MPTITPGTLNLDMYAGAEFEVPLVMYYNGSIVDVTGYDARMKARIDYTDSTAYIDLTVSDGITIDGPNGKFTIRMPGVDTAAVGAALGYVRTQLVYDVEIVDTAGIITRLVQGYLTVWPEATR